MVPRCLTIATSDSGGGAGIQADLKAFAALGCHGMSAIVALTAQSTTSVTAVHEAPPAFARAHLDAVFDDIGVDAAKTGMLFSARIIEVVADFLRDRTALRPELPREEAKAPAQAAVRQAPGAAGGTPRGGTLNASPLARRLFS